jgi:hypothetical protein
MLKTDSNDFVKQIYDKLNKLASDSDNKQKYETMLNDFCKMMGIKRADLDKLFSPESKAQSEEKEKIAKEIQKRFYEIYSTKDKGVPGDVPIACQKFISRFEDYKTTSATEDAFSWITNYFMGWTTQSMPGGMPIGMAGANTSFDVVVPQRGGRWYSSTSAFLTYALLNDVYQNWQTRPAGTAVGTLSTLFYGYSGIAKMQLLIGVPLVAFGFINPFFFLTAAGLTAFSLFSFANYSSAMQSNRIARVRMGAQSYGVDLALYAENKIHMPTALKETISRGGIKPEQTIQIMNMSIGDMLRRPFDLYTWITVFDKLTNPISSQLHSAGFNITVEMAGSTQPKFTPSLHTFISAGYSLVSAVLFLKMMDAVSMGNYMEVPYSFVFLLWSYFQLKIAIGTEQMSRLGANFIKDGEVVRTGKFLQGAVENESDYRKDIKETLFD